MIILMVLIIAISYSCNKSGTPPTCNINYPEDGQVFNKCDDIEVNVKVVGSSTETNLIIDGDWKVTQSERSEISIVWNTNYESLTDHKIVASTWNRKGTNAVDEITVKIKPNANDKFTDPRDGQEYYTVNIGEQTWFAQDLRYYISDTGCIALDSYNSGYIYNWNSAIIACPDGWHLATDDDWKELEAFIGMSAGELDEFGPRGTDEGYKLKCKCGWGWETSSGYTGSDSYNFSALPNINSHELGYATQNTWWTGSGNSDFTAFTRIINGTQINREVSAKDIKNSVRCIKD
jgi:uncharacterized protein (TIGR02145 family)